MIMNSLSEAAAAAALQVAISIALVYRKAGWVGGDDDVEEPGGWL